MSISVVFTLLPQLRTTAGGTVDFKGSNSAIRSELSEAASSSARIWLKGLSELGRFLADGSVVEQGVMAPDRVEACGALIAELAVAVEMLLSLSERCSDHAHRLQV